MIILIGFLCPLTAAEHSLLTPSSPTLLCGVGIKYSGAAVKVNLIAVKLAT